MDTEHIDFFFGADGGHGYHPDDFDDDATFIALLEPTLPRGLSPLERAMRFAAAAEMTSDESPEVWATVRRLLALGLNREQIFDNIVIALTPLLSATLHNEVSFDRVEYLAALDQLPVPDIDELVPCLFEIAQASPGIALVDLASAAVARLRDDPENRLVQDMVQEVIGQLVDDGQELEILDGDRIVHGPSLTAGIVLTRMLTSEEMEHERLNVGFDLAAFDPTDDLLLPNGGVVETIGGGPDDPVWFGPDGWFDPFAAEAILAFSIDADDTLLIVELADAPRIEDELVARLRAVYDRAIEEAGLPVTARELVLGLLVQDPTTFARPRAPVSELALAAGLEIRGSFVAHDPTTWSNALSARRSAQVYAALGPDPDRAKPVLRAFELSDQIVAAADDERDASGAPIPPVDRAELQALLADLGEPEVVTVTGELIFGDNPDAKRGGQLFIDALISASSRGAKGATARLLAAHFHEHHGEPLVAEQQLEIAHAEDSDNAMVIDRLAWYASDRGDAAKATRLWRELERNERRDRDLATVAPFATPRPSPLGRNEPCWCGSGRKFKQCHLGTSTLAPLPERIGWLCRKAVAYIEHMPTAGDDVFRIAHALITDPHDHDALRGLFDDPLLFDLLLTEGGWFSDFLSDRGALLPEDEALLGASWLLVDRSVHEILSVEPGVGLAVQDLRSSETFSVREKTLSRTTRPGILICARVVPDGESHQFVGGIFPVTPGHESALLDILDDGDPHEIAEWVASGQRPPTLETREGEPLVQCDIVIDFDDEAPTIAFLDATYEREADPDGHPDDGEPVWVELFALNDDEQIVRARLHLDASSLHVSTSSEARADRVLAEVHRHLPDARVHQDRRAPLDAALLSEAKGRGLNAFPIGDRFLDDEVEVTPELEAALDSMQEQFERRWCDEHVPALGGLTPREAVADPTRREQVERLIATLEVPSGTAVVGMRPQKLRELLGL